MIRWLLPFLLLSITAYAQPYNAGGGGGSVISSPGYSDTKAKAATGWTKSGTNVVLTTSTDNVGIGTTTPTAKLQIGGALGPLKITPNWYSSGAAWIDIPTDGPSGIGSGGPGSDAWLAYASSGGQWFNSGVNAGDIIFRKTDGALLYGNSPSEFVMRVANDRVGIGHQTATARLHLSGRHFTGSGSITDDGAGNISGNGTYFTGELAVGDTIYVPGQSSQAIITSITNDSTLQLDNSTGANDENFEFTPANIFQVDDVNGLTPMSISTVGQTIIGALGTADNALTVKGSFQVMEIQGNFSTGGQETFVKVDNINNSSYALFGVRSTGAFFQHQAAMDFRIEQYGGGQGKLATGNLSVGTTTYTNLLDVKGAAAFGTYGSINTAPSNGLIVSGNVGIGSTTPGQKLDVQGTIRAFGSVKISNGGNVTFSGTAPTVASNDCGTTSQGTVTTKSTNNAGSITVGTLAVTSCAMTFNTAVPYVNAPFCVVTDDSTILTVRPTTTTTKLTIASTTSMSGDVISWVCFGGE